MKKTQKLGLSQANADTPAWIVKLVAVVAVVNLVKDAVVTGFPAGNTEVIMDWVDWSITVLNAVISVVAAFLGRAISDKRKYYQ
ncbi:hypothetical protein [Chitinophaga rhizosphaerae]|uniref:hypothetical protein n=1 Tax=Chitinophaga rhizosphaerae TaxID=1864947 RepID=UPI000F810BFF|nr:hypothetical protein [Chitinophaga rhizosphaerae]